MNLAQIEPWAWQQMCALRMDVRRRRNLAWMASRLAARSGLSLSALLGEAGRKAAYRIFSSMKSSLLQGHTQATLARLESMDKVLVALDTTDLNYHGHAHTKGIGWLGGFVGQGVRGLSMHTALAMNWQGEPLGLLHQHIWAPVSDQSKGRKVPFAQRESYRWIDCLKVLAAQGLSAKALVICDREADMYDFFVEAQKLSLQSLVRCHHLQRFAYAGHGLDTGADLASIRQLANGLPALGQMEIPLPSGQKKSMRVQLWAGPITMPVSRSGRSKDQGSIPLWLVRTHELNPQEGRPPAEWILLTGRPVTTFMEAAETVGCYARRWLVERFHFVLKQGLRAERLQVDEFERLCAALTLFSVVAVRLLTLTLAGQTRPTDEPDGLLEKEQQNLLEKWSKKPIKTVQDCILTLAKLGGHLGKKPPGPIPIWHGLRSLEAMYEGYKMALNLSVP